ncbi:MAG TPA: Hsp20/alpha crystallin family protein [Casimicrobiaceae bacterium]|jgi:HSP20 family protein
MANDRQSRQQSSERAQTSGGAAQQGEWQPSQRSSMGSQGAYPQESQTSSRSNVARRREMGPDFGYPGFGPFSLMRRLTDDIDRIFENFGTGRSLFPTELWHGGALGRESSVASWAPRIEMGEKEGKLCISADLPGVKKEDLDVHIDEDAVTIAGERRQERTVDESGYYQSERSYGSFYRSIPLPEGMETDSATAEFKDGVLQIEIPAPRLKSRGRKLEIKD